MDWFYQIVFKSLIFRICSSRVSNAMPSARGRTYKPVGRIARIIFGELSGERSDRRRQ
jgi:hypothetical protein